MHLDVIFQSNMKFAFILDWLIWYQPLKASEGANSERYCFNQLLVCSIFLSIAWQICEQGREKSETSPLSWATQETSWCLSDTVYSFVLVVSMFCDCSEVHYILNEIFPNIRWLNQFPAEFSEWTYTCEVAKFWTAFSPLGIREWKCKVWHPTVCSTGQS